MILIAGKIPESKRLVDWLQRELGEGVAYEPDLNLAFSQYTDAQVMIGPATDRITAERVAQCSELRWYHALSAGVDDLPLQQFAKQHVKLTNSSGIHGIPMAEQVMGMMLMFSRNLHSYVRNQLNQEWSRDYPKLDELYGKTLCIVGAGRIGQAVAERAKAFGMHVLGVKRTAEALPNFDEVVSTAYLKQVLAKSDYVLLLIPLTESTRHFFRREHFQWMKPTAIFLNFARGDVVDEDGLVQALEERSIAGAGIDVTSKEPLPMKHPLWEFSNVILTPHVAGVSQLYYDRAFKLFAENYREWVAGRPLPNEVNLELGY